MAIIDKIQVDGTNYDISTSLENLSDTSFSTLVNGQIPVYNATENKWKNASSVNNAEVANKVKFDSYDIEFGIDSNGNYGYKKAGADTVTPFRNPQTKTVTPTSESQIVEPDESSGYNCLSEVTVQGIPYREVETEHGITVIIG